MDDRAYGIARAAIAEKDSAYFAEHGLADLLGEAGVECGPCTVLALARRLAADDTYAFLAPVSAGLRDIAPDGDDDGLARIVGAVAAAMRRDAFQGPFVDVLADVGRDHPDRAVGAASRLIELGDADYAAYMIGGAYGGAPRECDALIERLLSSGIPGDAAAALRSLRVASADHGLPDAGRVRAAVERALAHGDAGVQREAIEALLALCRRGDSAAERMIEPVLSGHASSRRALAAHIWRDSPFDDEKSLRYLEACMAWGPEQYTLHSAYGALTKMAGRMPGGVARMLVRMFDSGWHHGALAGLVLDELGRRGAPAAIAAMLEALQRPHDDALDGRLWSAVGRIARLADRDEAAALALRTIDERPAALAPCLRVLSLLALEDWRRGGGHEFAEGVMSRLCAHPAGRGGGGGPERGGITDMPA